MRRGTKKLSQPLITIDASNSPSLDIALELTREQFSAQDDYASALDSKAGFVLGSASLLTGVLVTLRTSGASVTFGINGLLGQAAPFLELTLLITPICIYLLVVTTAYIAYRLHSYLKVPNPNQLASSYLVKPEAETKAVVFATMILAFNENERILRAKSFWTRAALVALWAEAIVVAVLLVVQNLP